MIIISLVSLGTPRETINKYMLKSKVKEQMNYTDTHTVIPSLQIAVL